MKNLFTAVMLSILAVFASGCVTSDNNTIDERAESAAPPIDAEQLFKGVRESYRSMISRPPTQWRERNQWRPVRYTGPFPVGSELHEIQIILDGNSGEWFFNDFFENHPSQDIYRKYYRFDFSAGSSFATTALPNNTTKPTPVNRSVTEAGNGANHVLLSLTQIEYSSKYGGTVRLVFKVAEIATVHDQSTREVFDYEFLTPDYWFDVDGLEMSIFVYPIPFNFNPTGHPNTNQGPAFVEFDYAGVQAYGYQDGVVSATEMNDSASQNLAAVLADLSENVSNLQYRGLKHANRFTLGFLHDQFQSLFDELTFPNEKVEKLFLADNFIDIVTEEKRPVFMLMFRLEDIDVGDEAEVWANNWHVWRNGLSADSETREIIAWPSNNGLGRAYVFRDLEPGESTPWSRLGMWNISDCPWLDRVRFNAWIGDDRLFGTRVYGPTDIEFAFDCNKLNDLVEQGEWGAVADPFTEDAWPFGSWAQEDAGIFFPSDDDPSLGEFMIVPLVHGRAIVQLTLR